ncbi:MAG: GNAT family N-acetyltransferase [Alphaproteobacteria bacterium]|nr:GNAT family N-acetyltransferase [Alphaproteobacteria bacterium]
MEPADLPAVERIGGIVHPLFPERPEVPAERLGLFPGGCLVAASSMGPMGYAVAHPWVTGAPPALDVLLGSLPPQADCLYLHDVALLPQLRGSGLGAQLVGMLVALAGTRGLARLALTAVGGSAGYWQRHGFAAWEAGDAALAGKLASYGGDAVYMVRPL